MSWLRIDDKFPEHSKIEPLSDAAFRLHVSALAHCAKHETDGFISAEAAERLTRHKNKAPFFKELERAIGIRADGKPLWKPAERNGIVGWDLHDFTVWNPSHADQETKRKAAKERMQRTRAPQVRKNIGQNIARTSSEPVSTPHARARWSGRDLELGDGEQEQTDVWRRADPDESSPEAVAESVDDSESEAPESGYDLAQRCFREAFEQSYKRPFFISTDTGQYGDDHVLQRLGNMAIERGGDDAERWMRHWAERYLADQDPWLAEHAHPLRALEKRLNKYGVPKAPTAPRRERLEPAEPPPERMPSADYVARIQALTAATAAALSLESQPARNRGKPAA